MQRTLFVTLLIASIAFAAPPTTENPTAYQSDLYGMIGDWSGVVTHFEYGKDTVRTTFPAEFSADTTGGLLITRMVYDSRDGEHVVDWGEWVVSPSGHTLQFDSEKMWFVSGKNITDNGTTLVFQARDMDNGAPAQIVNVLYIGTRDSLVYAQKVLPDKAGREFLRREFRLGRKGE